MCTFKRIVPPPHSLNSHDFQQQIVGDRNKHYHNPKINTWQACTAWRYHLSRFCLYPTHKSEVFLDGLACSWSPEFMPISIPTSKGCWHSADTTIDTHSQLKCFLLSVLNRFQLLWSHSQRDPPSCTNLPFSYQNLISVLKPLKLLLSKSFIKTFLNRLFYQQRSRDTKLNWTNKTHMLC